MWPIIGILAAGIMISAIEIPPLLKQKQKKELITFSILLLFAISLSIAESLRLPIPNPLDWITTIYQPISDFTYSLLE
ncbi:hypothetical protein [Bacillus taeanensis]|uniref:Uncharacterized protein n=1 Tax=Bacillus taeanensis TaxID=273032 RepID=A0A366XTP7_9BACI|nr:hypothetical protein [Bacillus taeanensis]RBW67331.1 hypothetical protein DS031_22785 [Bacillus taeanensis]